MSTTVGVVDLPVSPTGSSAHSMLAGRRFAGSTLLEWVARRLTEVEALDETVILLDQQHADLQQLAPANIAVHLSAAEDPLARLADVCDAHQASAIVRVSVDTPFVDPVLVDQLICSANEHPCDYVTYCACDGTSAIQNRLGLVAEWIGAAALNRAQTHAMGRQRMNPSESIWSHPEAYQLRFITVPESLDRQGLRLVIDSEEDWDHAHQIYEALGPDGLDWRRIAILLGMHGKANPMAAVNEEAS